MADIEVWGGESQKSKNYWFIVPLSDINTKLNAAGLPKCAILTSAKFIVNASFSGGVAAQVYVTYGFGHSGQLNKTLFNRTNISTQGGTCESIELITTEPYFADKVVPAALNLADYGSYLVIHMETANWFEPTMTVDDVIMQVTYSGYSHSYNSGVVTTQPTCTSTGVKTFTCSVCGATKTETIAKTAHNSNTTIPAVAPTCTATGLTEGKKCSVCGTVTVAQQTVPKLDHNYTSTVVPPTEDSHGYTRHTCSRCGHYYDDSYTYLVRWYNEDGSVLLETDSSVPYGDMPSCSVTPTKAATAQYTYQHVGWAISPTAENTTGLTAVVANIDYYARFSKTTKTYTVKWLNDGGILLETDTLVPYGDQPDYNGKTPTKASTAQYDYTFLGWSAMVDDDEGVDDTELPTVTGNITYRAVFLPVVRQYQLDILTHNCTVEGAVSGTYDYGTEFTVTVKPEFGYDECKSIDLLIGEAEDAFTYDGNELTFILTDNTVVIGRCLRSLAPIFASPEQQIKEVYIVPAINTIVYQVEGDLPALETKAHTVDDWHFVVINAADIYDTPFGENHDCYPVDMLYVNETRIW